MLSAEVLERCVQRVALMKFFPGSDPGSCAVVAEEIAAMCGDDNQALWLARQFTIAHKEWPGLGELRAFFCACFRPLDGIDTYSSVFPDGVPRKLLGTPPGVKFLPEPAALPAPHEEQTTVDPELELTVKELAESATMPLSRRPRTVQEIEAELYKKRAGVPLPQEQRYGYQSDESAGNELGRPRITEADFEALRKATAGDSES